MFPFVEAFGTKISVMGIGIIICLITFLITTYQLCQKNHQDFFKLFYQLPLRIIIGYLLGRYTEFALETGVFLPRSLGDWIKILQPHNFHLHYVGMGIAMIFCLGRFFSSIKRTENKKIWADILFSWISNALIILGIFLTLGDSFIGSSTESAIAIKTFHPESNLNKFWSVYPIGIFLSIGVLCMSMVINLLKIFLKKNGLGLRGFIGMIITLLICFQYQYYPRHGIINILNSSRDIKEYLSVFMIGLITITIIKRNKKRFY